MKTKALNPMQRRAVLRVLRYFRKRNAYSGCTSVRFKLEPMYGRSYSLVVQTRRSDCHPSSPRAIVCGQYAHFFVGPRGKLTVASAYHGVGGDPAAEPQHLAIMLDAHVSRR